MSQAIEKIVEACEHIVRLNEGDEVIHSPLEDLYYWIKGKEPINLNNLTFAGDGLYRSTLLTDVKTFSLEFDGESEDEMDREAWADPLRADVLKGLTGKDRSWYISFVGDYTEQIIKQDQRKVPEALTSYFAQKDPAEVAIVDSRPPYGYGGGIEKRFFFEVPTHEIDWFVRNIWPAAYQGYPIEGYNFASGKIARLKSWNEKSRDELLFREVIDQTFTIFYTHPEEHLYFAFLTNKLSFSEFTHLIDLEGLKRKAQDL